MEKKPGYRTITYRFRLYCEPMMLLVETKKMYNRVLSFYYDILLKEPELLQTPKLKLMRQLEILTVGTKEQPAEDIRYPIPFEKVPLYFRRAAINDAIRLNLSFRSGEEQGAQPAEAFDASPCFYKGMYKEFTSESIWLKLYDGAAWKWTDCRINTCGRPVPREEQMLSPMVVLKGSRAMLHIPVKEDVEDVRTVKERMPETKRICAVYFPQDDTMAAAVILSEKGEFLAGKFIRGGRALNHRKRLILKQIKENRRSMGADGADKATLPEEENKALKEKIHRMTDDAAHKVSRELVDFCREQNAEILVVPKYGQGKGSSGTSFAVTGNFDWLGRRIISYVKYKSFGEGIVTATVGTKDILKRCYQCGEPIKRQGKDFSCPNGHAGNAYFNAANNVGKRFLEVYGNL